MPPLVCCTGGATVSPVTSTPSRSVMQWHNHDFAWEGGHPTIKKTMYPSSLTNVAGNSAKYPGIHKINALGRCH